ncbi:hypothetical protein KCU83_g645, partial [Aureobasidium melanogenum]
MTTLIFTSSLTTAYIQRSFLTLLRSDLKSYILQQSRQANMNDRAHEGDHPTGEGDSHHDDTSSTPAAKARYERAMELESQAQTLSREMDKIDAEGHQHYREWNRYNRRYLRLQKRTGNTAEPLVLNIDNTAQLQQASDLLALDAQRANTQLAMTQIRQRLLEIQAELKKMYIEFAMLLGSQESPGFAKDMQWLSEEEKRHHKMRKELGEQMLKRAIVGGLQIPQTNHSRLFLFTMADAYFLGASNASWIMTDAPGLSSAGTETPGSDAGACNSTPQMAQAPQLNQKPPKTTFKASTTSLQQSLTYVWPPKTESRVFSVTWPATQEPSRNTIPPITTQPAHTPKRLEFQALIQETLGQGSQLINKVLVLLGEKAELLYVEIDSDEMRERLYDWAGFGLELDRSQPRSVGRVVTIFSCWKCTAQLAAHFLAQQHLIVLSSMLSQLIWARFAIPRPRSQTHGLFFYLSIGLSISSCALTPSRYEVEQDLIALSYRKLLYQNHEVDMPAYSYINKSNITALFLFLFFSTEYILSCHDSVDFFLFLYDKSCHIKSSKSILRLSSHRAPLSTCN